MLYVRMNASEHVSEQVGAYSGIKVWAEEVEVHVARQNILNNPHSTSIHQQLASFSCCYAPCTA